MGEPPHQLLRCNCLLCHSWRRIGLLVADPRHSATFASFALRKFRELYSELLDVAEGHPWISIPPVAAGGEVPPTTGGGDQSQPKVPPELPPGSLAQPLLPPLGEASASEKVEPPEIAPKACPPVKVEPGDLRESQDSKEDTPQAKRVDQASVKKEKKKKDKKEKKAEKRKAKRAVEESPPVEAASAKRAAVDPSSSPEEEETELEESSRVREKSKRQKALPRTSSERTRRRIEDKKRDSRHRSREREDERKRSRSRRRRSHSRRSRRREEGRYVRRAFAPEGEGERRDLRRPAELRGPPPERIGPPPGRFHQPYWSGRYWGTSKGAKRRERAADIRQYGTDPHRKADRVARERGS